MANAKEIKGRMQSIANTKQITSAMKMVSASKLRRAQKQVGAGRPYQEKLRQVLAQVAASASGELYMRHSLLSPPTKGWLAASMPMY